MTRGFVVYYTVAIVVEFVTNFGRARVYLGIGVITIANPGTLTARVVSIVILVYTGRRGGLGWRRACGRSGFHLGLGLTLAMQDRRRRANCHSERHQ